MDRTELLKILKALTPRELRVITYEHNCRQTTSLHECCGELRCEACHILHLKGEHETAALHAYERFASAGKLTWPGYEPTKVNKKVTKRNQSVSSKPVSRAKSFDVKDLSPEQLDRLAQLLIERSSK